MRWLRRADPLTETTLQEKITVSPRQCLWKACLVWYLFHRVTLWHLIVATVFCHYQFVLLNLSLSANIGRVFSPAEDMSHLSDFLWLWKWIDEWKGIVQQCGRLWCRSWQSVLHRLEYWLAPGNVMFGLQTFYLNTRATPFRGVG